MNTIQYLRAMALTSIMLALPLGVQAKEAPAVPSSVPAAKAARPVPYAGVVNAVDATGKTFTFKDGAGTRTFVVVATTKIENTATKQPAKFEDITVNAYITGSYLKKGDTLEAYSVRLGKSAPGKPEMKKKPAAPAATDTNPAKNP